MLSNVIGHVSDVNVPRCNLLFFMMQDDYTINIARLISDELQRFIGWEVSQSGSRRGW